MPLYDNCEVCGKQFHINTSNRKIGQSKYCSKSCYGKSKANQVELKCFGCGVKFSRWPSKIKKGKEPFCTMACYKKYIIGNPKERFLKRIRKIESGCWEWMGSRNGADYGVICFKRKRSMAHRFSWEVFNGPIPEGLQACHKCDNPPCCNPDHLFLGNQSENILDCVEKGRKNPAKGTRTSKSKLTENQVLEIRRRYVPWKCSTYTLAKEFGVGANSIYSIIKRKHWKHIH